MRSRTSTGSSAMFLACSLAPVSARGLRSGAVVVCFPALGPAPQNKLSAHLATHASCQFLPWHCHDVRLCRQPLVVHRRAGAVHSLAQKAPSVPAALLHVLGGHIALAQVRVQGQGLAQCQRLALVQALAVQLVQVAVAPNLRPLRDEQEELVPACLPKTEQHSNR